MSAESSRNVLVHLREMDERYTRLRPAHGAESRLLARLQAPTPRKNAIGLAWQTAWRPLAVVIACAIILALSLHDDIPLAQRRPFQPLFPNVPAASTDVHAPMPKTPRKQEPTFLDTVAPTARPSNEPPTNLVPPPPFL